MLPNWPLMFHVIERQLIVLLVSGNKKLVITNNCWIQNSCENFAKERNSCLIAVKYTKIACQNVRIKIALKIKSLTVKIFLQLTMRI
jgi:hypothetical protein